jgi:DNA-binding transcriptional regulator YhcF (GntR family)
MMGLPMKQEYTDGVRKALGLARDAAIELQHDYVGTEHLLLGLMRAPEGGSLLDRIGLEIDVVSKEIRGTIRMGRAPVFPGQLPYTSRSKKSLEYAMAAARDLGESQVGIEHLLLGLLREEKSIAAQVLKHFGVTNESVLQAVLTPDAPARFRVHIDAPAEGSTVEQIVAQVQDAVASGVLLPGDRLPTVRQLADELDVAPGQVSRAYAELEARGVLLTDGARGPRVAEAKRTSQPDFDRLDTIMGLMKPVAIAAQQLGASEHDLRAALERAIAQVYGSDDMTGSSDQVA